MTYKTFLNGELVKTGAKPTALPGVKLSRLDLATPDQLEKHGIVIEEYTLPGPSPDDVWMQMNREVNQYLFQKYDSGTQLSFIALYARADTPQTAKDAIQSVWDWQKTVLNYYYDKKSLILDGDITITWDFEQFDVTDPDIGLGDLRSAA